MQAARARCYHGASADLLAASLAELLDSLPAVAVHPELSWPEYTARTINSAWLLAGSVRWQVYYLVHAGVLLST